MPSVSWKWWTRAALLEEELWQGLARRNCLWGFAQISAYFFRPWDVPICSAFNPSPHPEVCERPGLAVSSSYSSMGFPGMDSKTCIFLKSRTRGERGTCWGSRALLLINVVREDTPRAQTLQQYLLWLWAHQGGRHRECFWPLMEKIWTAAKLWCHFFIPWHTLSHSGKCQETKALLWMTQFNICSNEVFYFNIGIWGLYFLLLKSVTQVFRVR